VLVRGPGREENAEAGRGLRWPRPATLKPGDVALVISQNLQDFYAIGVLSGGGASNHDAERGRG